MARLSTHTSHSANMCGVVMNASFITPHVFALLFTINDANISKSFLWLPIMHQRKIYTGMLAL